MASVRMEFLHAFPVFDYSLTPYVALSFFDPDEPLRAEAGAQFKASYRPAPGLIFAGKFRYPFGDKPFLFTSRICLVSTVSG